MIDTREVPSALLNVFLLIFIFLKDLMSNKLVLGYWGIRGRANPIRYLLEYTEVPYEEKTYQGPDWGAEKPVL